MKVIMYAMAENITAFPQVRSPKKRIEIAHSAAIQRSIRKVTVNNNWKANVGYHNSCMYPSTRMASSSVAGGHELIGKFTVGNVEINSALTRVLTAVTIKVYPRTMNNVRLEPISSRKSIETTSIIPVYRIHTRKKSMEEFIKAPPTKFVARSGAIKLTNSWESG